MSGLTTLSLTKTAPTRYSDQDALLCEMQIDAEGDFPAFPLLDALQERGVHRVLDAATGFGYHSSRLRDAGLDVVSVDANRSHLHQAFDFAVEKGHRLNVVQAEWQYLRRRVGDGYDAIICLGDLFSSLFKLPERRRILAEFFGILNYDGLLCLEHRNYDLLLSHAGDSDLAYHYDPPGLRVEPVFVDNGMVRWAYQAEGEEALYLNTYPLLKNEFRTLALDVGFQEVETFPVRKAETAQNTPDFWMHLAEKK